MVKKELNVCKELKSWFERYGIKCWLNIGENKFTTKLSQKKPDMVIFSNLLKQYIAIEVKQGGNTTEIYNASKILDYNQEYSEGKIEYCINEQKIEISSFVVATISSMYGKLFIHESENAIDSFEHPDDWKKVQIKYNLEPRWEYPSTKAFLRSLWANWRRFRKTDTPGIGIILSDVLNFEKITESISHPLLFDMQWKKDGDKARWKVQQNRL